MMFDVAPIDPPAFAIVVLLFLAVALAACWVPARRAMRIEPIDALRREYVR